MHIALVIVSVSNKEYGMEVFCTDVHEAYNHLYKAREKSIEDIDMCVVLVSNNTLML